MASKPDWFDGAVGPMVKQVQDDNRALVEAIREDSRRTLQELGGQIQEVKQVQVQQGEDVKELRRDVQQLQREHGSASTPAQSIDDNFRPR